MYMKVDYIRLYQDLGDDLDADNYMQVGCDPSSHPTREWILGHLKDYEDADNKMVEVPGQAFCKTDDDCTVSPSGNIKLARLVTGKCIKKRCQCSNGRAWGGPRCTFAMKGDGFSPPWAASFAVAAVAVVVCVVVLWRRSRMTKRQLRSRQMHAGALSSKSTARGGDANGVLATPSHTTYNLV
ncbi:hypothetical protein PINS_up008337 [Pythium insidiosum]|nr:hypothetical protein PINS_up008337 [Pythium insidiosum]